MVASITLCILSFHHQGHLNRVHMNVKRFLDFSDQQMLKQTLSFLLLLSAIQRHRLLPVLPLDDASRGRRLGSRWADLPPFTTGLKKPLEIKVYEIDDVKRIRREGLTGAEVRRSRRSKQTVLQNTTTEMSLCFNLQGHSRARMKGANYVAF